jgi:hypothetical protein
MPAGRYITNNDIINRVAVEIGLTPVTDVFSTSDPVFRQLTYLLTTSVQELMELFPWQSLIREFQYTTVQDQIGIIDLPADFAYMIDQTGWERTQNVPLIGPMSPQDWTYLLGRDLVGSTIYASFRFDQDKFYIFPNNPMPAGLDINFEYISSNLIQVAATDPVEYTDSAQNPGDTPLFPAHLITRFLKVKILEAKGFDSQKAEDNFWQAFYSWSGKDNSAQILNAGRQWRGFPYLDMWRNLPDTGYGQTF